MRIGWINGSLIAYRKTWSDDLSDECLKLMSFDMAPRKNCVSDHDPARCCFSANIAVRDAIGVMNGVAFSSLR